MLCAPSVSKYPCRVVSPRSYKVLNNSIYSAEAQVDSLIYKGTTTDAVTAVAVVATVAAAVV